MRPDGEVRYIRCVGAPVVENQELKKLVGSAMDVTEHENSDAGAAPSRSVPGGSSKAQSHRQLRVEDLTAEKLSGQTKLIVFSNTTERLSQQWTQ